MKPHLLLLSLALAACTRGDPPQQEVPPMDPGVDPDPDRPLLPDRLDPLLDRREVVPWPDAPDAPDPPEPYTCVGDAALAVAAEQFGPVGDSGTLMDVTGDGRLDLVLGVVDNSYTAGFPQGRVVVTSSQQRGVVIQPPGGWDQVWKTSWLGMTLLGCCATSGDLDGEPRILVGAPFYQRHATPGDDGGVGRAYLLAPPLPPGELILEDVAVATAGGDGADYLGAATLLAGDLTGDGRANWLAGGPRWMNTLPPEPGILAVFDSGQTGALRRSHDALAVLRGNQPDDEFGRSAHAVDQDGDGVPELVVAAYETYHPDADTRGSVYWFHTPLNGDLITADDAFAERTSVSVESAMGLSMDAGDLDGDGYPEVVVSAHTDHSDGFRAGRVYLIHGPDPGSGPIDQGTSIIRGGGPAHSMGVRVRVVGDLDGDGIDDLAVTAPKNPYFISEPGELLLFLGPIQGTLDPTDAAYRWTSDCPGDRAGADLDIADVDGDGKLDFLVAAPWSRFKPDAQGGAYLLLGADLGLP